MFAVFHIERKPINPYSGRDKNATSDHGYLVEKRLVGYAELFKPNILEYRHMVWN